MKQDKLRPGPISGSACVLLTALLAGTSLVEAVVSEENRIEHIQTCPGGVEVHLRSSRAFPVRAIPPVLQIGSEVFDRSYRPTSGELNRLIFLLPRGTRARLHKGESVHVLYGLDASPRATWDFGAFP